MLKEFKAFAMRGNVLDMAVGIIIGAAFGKIITSLVSDVLMPPLRTRARQGGFFQPLPEYFRDLVCDAGGGKSGGSGDNQLRNVPEHGDRLSYRGIRDFHAGATSEPME